MLRLQVVHVPWGAGPDGGIWEDGAATASHGQSDVSETGAGGNNER